MAKLQKNETLEESVMNFISLWESYWNAGALEGPSKKDLDKAIIRLKKLAHKW